MESSISLEETNKIRISLGLKPLTDDKAPTGNKDKEAEDNFAKAKELERKERETKKIQEGIAKVRNRRELHASLKGATLGDAEGDVDDTLKWIKRSRKKEKELAKKRQQELEERDKEILADYTERDLAGLKVSHDLDALDDGEERILTLKDSRILDNEEDELHNIDMAEKEKDEKRKELKLKKRDYKGYDDDEFTDGFQGGLGKRSILAKYDEDIEGSRTSEFRLGSSVVPKAVKAAEEQQAAAAAVNKSLLTIDYSKNLEVSDYLQEGEAGFKKIKKKKRSSRRAPLDAEPDETKMDVDGPAVPVVRDLNANFVDDDDLQAALARSRQAKLRKVKKLTPEQLAKKIAEEKAREEEERQAAMKKEEEETGLTFDETSEFVQTVGTEPIVKVKREPREQSMPNSGIKQERSPSRDVSMAPGDVALDELEAGEVRVKDEEDDMDMEMLDDIEAAIHATEVEEAAHNEDLGTSSERTFSSGMASTLNILRQQGILAAPSADQLERERVQKQRDQWLTAQRLRVQQREIERQQARYSNKDQAQREYENRMRDQHDAREQMEMYKDYKPDVNITYYDDNGRELTIKEAWKALSHKFHGKGSGRMKTEKRLKRIEEERKQMAMASGDTPLSMNRAFQIRQEKVGQAHFVLSVGNRGAVPQGPEFLETQPLAKGKTEKNKKKKEGKEASKQADIGFMSVPAPQLLAVAGDRSGSASGSPAPKAGFSRISAAVVESSSQASTPGLESRPKVAFGLGTKRKAGEEAAGSPNPKRRS